jgi:4-oxalocrotonate tautomerase
MPLVRIDLRHGKTAEYRRKIGESVHRAMAETINVPEHDRFQVITDHPAEGLVYDPGYLGINRTDNIVFIQITLNAGRTLEQKKALYARIAALLSEDPGIRPEDVVINLVECAKEDWSFGNGLASYAT